MYSKKGLKPNDQNKEEQMLPKHEKSKPLSTVVQHGGMLHGGKTHMVTQVTRKDRPSSGVSLPLPKFLNTKIEGHAGMDGGL